MVLRTDDLQLTRGESVRDTAYVLSRHVAAIGIRTGADQLVEELAEHASVPVINMLTPGHHPCQALADLLTLGRRSAGSTDSRLPTSVTGTTWPVRSRWWERVPGCRCAWPRPTATSSSPTGPASSPTIRMTRSRRRCVYTDVWVSMSDEPESAAGRRRALAPYQLDDGLLDRPPRTRSRCIACRRTRARRSPSRSLYGARQRIWDQAENRRHAQKALLELLIGA